MAKPDYWATTPWNRKQFVLVRETLDEAIAGDHPVRIFDDILGSLDWTEWEAGYSHSRGRPPIHPRKLVSLLLYGLSKGLRSSRTLEESCKNQIDILWLMEGLIPDHSTICNFRTGNEQQLKALFCKVCVLAAHLGLARLNRVAVDGTSIRANNGRHRVVTQESAKKRLAALEQQIEEMLKEAEALDKKEDESLGDRSPEIPEELRDAQLRKKKLQETLKTLQEMDEAKKKEGVKTKSQLPETDPDSRVLPNKSGGFAPNYTAMVTTDEQCGVVLDCVVIPGNVEAQQTIPSTDRIADCFQRPPGAVLADGYHAQGQNIEDFEDRNIPFYSPLPSSPPASNPANRPDPTQPVAEDQWDQLPRRGGKKNAQFDKSAFVYVHSENAYYCPQGKRLSFVFQERRKRGAQIITMYRYEAADCRGCPLMSRCISRGTKRTVRRDQYSEARERHAEKMRTDAAKTEYKKRMGIVEATFGMLKGNWDFRQFLLRGLTKVDTEWRWACTALNMIKIAAHCGGLRAVCTANQE